MDHTADLAVEMWAPTQEELLIVGARAIIEILTEGCPVTPDAVREIAIDGIDPEDRLVQWLNEIIYAAVTGGFLFAGGKLCLGDTTLVARIQGQSNALDVIRTELKSVTYHDLSLRREAGVWRAFVVIDV